MPILYGILFIMSIYMIVIIFLSVRHPYWSRQPVYHTHTLRYNFYHPGVVRTDPCPKEDRYVDLKNTEFASFESPDTSVRLSEFICENYVNTTDLIYKPSPRDLGNYYDAVKSSAFVTFLNSSTNTTNITVQPKQTTIGCISSRPIHVKTGANKLSVELVDLMCVNPMYRRKYEVPKLIQTHRHRLEAMGDTARVYMFKNESDTRFGIVPFCKCTNHVFDMFKWKTPTKLGQERLLELSDCSSDILVDTLSTSRFANKVYFDPFTIGQLIKNGGIHVFCLKSHSKTLGVYVFKKSSTSYKNESVFECVCSVKMCGNDMFLKGFHHAANECCGKYKYRYLVIEDTSDSGIIIDKIVSSKSAEYMYPVSYYFYNYITKQVDPSDTLMLI